MDIKQESSNYRAAAEGLEVAAKIMEALTSDSESKGATLPDLANPKLFPSGAREWFYYVLPEHKKLVGVALFVAYTPPYMRGETDMAIARATYLGFDPDLMFKVAANRYVGDTMDHNERWRAIMSATEKRWQPPFNRLHPSDRLPQEKWDDFYKKMNEYKKRWDQVDPQ